MLIRPVPLDPELERLLEMARGLPPMTRAQREEQRKSWVIGEMMLDDPALTREEAELRYDRAREKFL